MCEWRAISYSDKTMQVAFYIFSRPLIRRGHEKYSSRGSPRSTLRTHATMEEQKRHRKQAQSGSLEFKTATSHVIWES